MGQQNCHLLLMRIHSGTTILKTGWQLRKLIIYLLRDSAIAPFGISPKELKTYISTKTCTQIFFSSFIHNCENMQAP